MTSGEHHKAPRLSSWVRLSVLARSRAWIERRLGRSGRRSGHVFPAMLPNRPDNCAQKSVTLLENGVCGLMKPLTHPLVSWLVEQSRLLTGRLPKAVSPHSTPAVAGQKSTPK
jgi:hypothetical protein